ncbi:hypothetical protein DRO56_03680 [Candidatus Bathyarchaeota archaeon]|nr:MAG: hypothetical protein DRO56_03680 [Candidatus Bathyarchaeota archaeon]
MQGRTHSTSYIIVEPVEEPINEEFQDLDRASTVHLISEPELKEELERLMYHGPEKAIIARTLLHIIDKLEEKKRE